MLHKTQEQRNPGHKLSTLPAPDNKVFVGRKDKSSSSVDHTVILTFLTKGLNGATCCAPVVYGNEDNFSMNPAAPYFFVPMASVCHCKHNSRYHCMLFNLSLHMSLKSQNQSQGHGRRPLYIECVAFFLCVP